MSPEEFKRIKEAEKEHLRKLKALKQAAGRLQRQKSIAQALGNMTQEAQQKLDANEAMVEKLAWETAEQEARMEVALESAKETAPDASEAPKPSPDETDEASRKARAEELVRQMKQETFAEQTDVRDNPDVRPGNTPDDSNDVLPEKTIGRMS